MNSDEKNKRSKKVEEKKIEKKYAPDPAFMANSAKKSKIADKRKVDFNTQAAAYLASCTLLKSYHLPK